MGWYSLYGTGATLHGFQSSEEDEARVEFTSWLSILWIPVIPLRRWSAYYAGEVPPNVIGAGHAFVDLKRIPHDFGSLLQTFARGLFALGVAILPFAYMLFRTEGRAATDVEMNFVFASIAWPVVWLMFRVHRRNVKLRGRNNEVVAERSGRAF